MRKVLIAAAALAALAACAPRNPEVLPPEQLAPLAYRSNTPPSVTVYTVLNQVTGAGTHTALLVNGSERVLFDPASGFKAEGVTRSGDVLYGYTPGVESAYFAVHDRHNFVVKTTTFALSAESTERLLQQAKAYGPVAPAHCATSTIDILRTDPAFAALDTTYSPRKLGQQLDQLPGARSGELTSDMFRNVVQPEATKFDQRPGGA